MLTDKSGKKLEVGAYVDLHIPMIATGQIVDIKDSAIEVPGQGIIPPGIRVLISIDIPAGPNGGIWCYVVKDAPKPNEKEAKVTPFKVM